MKIVFLKAGKYKSETTVVEISQAHVESKKVFNIYTENALRFIKVKKAVEYIEPEPVKEPDPDDFKPPVPGKETETEDIEIDLDKMKLDELLEFAKGKEIDLGENTKKADVLDAIKAFEASKK